MAEEFTPFPHFATDALHAGQEPEQWNCRAVIPMISMSTTFKQEEPGKHAVSCFRNQNMIMMMIIILLDMLDICIP